MFYLIRQDENIQRMFVVRGDKACEYIGAAEPMC